ncbi:MAG: ParB N-terminal domain-containing protein, partial [Cyanobacteria bacterium P01_A01_bin.37]
MADEEALAFVFGDSEKANTTKPASSLSSSESTDKSPEESAPEKRLISLDDIKDRAEDTRQLNQAHVNALAESIAVLGLIEPLVTDKNYVLLAGGHRKAAISQLKEQNISAYKQHFADGILVRAMDFDALAETEKALAIEVAENEQRRDYSPSEVKAIATRLLDAGFVEVKGRPKKDEKPLMPTLSAVVGKSIRTIQNYLKEEELESTKDFALSENC